MGLLSFLHRKGAADAPAAAELAPVEVARQQARRRLIGAVVLVVAGVIGFPLLFDTTPRPVKADIAIDMPGKDAVAVAPRPAADAARTAASTTPPAVEPPAQRDAVITETADGRAADAAATRVPPKAPSVLSPSAPAERAAPKPAPAPSPPQHAVSSSGADATRAMAALEGKADAKPAAAAADAGRRFVVQVGAFSEANTARDVRARVERLGVKSYTQEIQTSAGKRIRVRAGPYADRGEADKVAAQLRQAGLTPAVSPL